jgi:hypothetical protein
VKNAATQSTTANVHAHTAAKPQAAIAALVTARQRADEKEFASDYSLVRK